MSSRTRSPIYETSKGHRNLQILHWYFYHSQGASFPATISLRHQFHVVGGTMTSPWKPCIKVKDPINALKLFATILMLQARENECENIIFFIKKKQSIKINIQTEFRIQAIAAVKLHLATACTPRGTLKPEIDMIKLSQVLGSAAGGDWILSIMLTPKPRNKRLGT